jgi:adenine-specific DNA-methyltransferase
LAIPHTYIQLQKAIKGKEKYADLYKGENYDTFERTGDIYALFYEKGINLLNQNGLLCYITSNKWMRAKYGKSLRNFFSDKKPIKLIDLGPGVFNTATVDTNILLIENSEQEQTALKALTLTDKEKINSLSDNKFTILTDLSEESWIILSPEEYRIKQKIEQIGTPLKDWDIKINYGIKTGYNEAFIIDDATKDKLIEKDPKSADIIKPILRGRDVKRYKAEFADLWLINTHNGYKTSDGKYIKPIDVNDYAAIKEHLDQYLEKLQKRQDKGITPYNLRNCAYLKEFEKEKIVFTKASKVPSFTLINSNELLLQTAYIATGNKIKFIIAFLNSKLINFCFYKFYQSGGIEGEITYQAIIVIPIIKTSKEQQKSFEILVDFIIFAKENGLENEAEKFESVIDGLVYDLYFEDEMKKANCYITDRITEVIEPFKENQTDEEKTKYIKKFYEFCSKDKIIFHSLIHRRTIKVVQIINGDK